jgi:hypothetical protein
VLKEQLTDAKVYRIGDEPEKAVEVDPKNWTVE